MIWVKLLLVCIKLVTRAYVIYVISSLVPRLYCSALECQKLMVFTHLVKFLFPHMQGVLE